MIFGLIILQSVFTAIIIYKLGHIEGRLHELSKPRYNSKEGQQIVRESEEIRTGLGMVNYHLERASSLEEAARSHRTEAQTISRRIQTEAEIAQERMTGGRD